MLRVEMNKPVYQHVGLPFTFVNVLCYIGTKYNTANLLVDIDTPVNIDIHSLGN